MYTSNVLAVKRYQLPGEPGDAAPSVSYALGGGAEMSEHVEGKGGDGDQDGKVHYE